jgi:hypothetical protein
VRQGLLDQHVQAAPGRLASLQHLEDLQIRDFTMKTVRTAQKAIAPPEGQAIERHLERLG